jgi:Asp-tRNA(Asn)/Glu-tRNA(Gln) amidotransferase A subunit family amidase
MTQPDALPSLGVRDLLAGYAAGHFTPTDTVEALIAHIDAWEPSLRALYAFDPDAARDAAADSTRRWHKGAPCGPLDGVPATIKDFIATKGTPTPGGTAASELVPAADDAPPAARMREAGAIIFAKTTMPDFGMLTSGLSSFHPLTRNPWNLRHNPGGSSAGAAAAAAAGYGPLHVGTDIGGSVRLPAALCGLVGFKPTLGRIPIDPYYIGRCAGPMTRTVDDAAYAMAVLAQPDARDATALPPADIDWHAGPASPAGLRIGVMLDGGCGLPCDQQIEASVLAAARVFEQAGATLVDVAPVLTGDILDGIDLFWRARCCAAIDSLPPGRADKILPFISAWAARGATASGPDAVAGFNQIFALKRACAALFAGVDVVLSPVVPVVAFPAEYASPLNDPERPFDHIVYTLPWNMSEQPAVSINCGFAADGMPIGLQIITRRFADWQALALARWYEGQRGPMTWPEPPAAFGRELACR